MGRRVQEDCKCFFITPIGKSGSPERERADKVLNHLIKPVLKEYGFLDEKIVRADEEAQPGRISQRVERHIREDHLCIIDLTGNNPNVMYEYGMRKGTGGSFIAIIEAGKIGELPFDVQDEYTMEYDLAGLDVYFETKAKFGRLIEFCIEQGLKAPVDPCTKPIDPKPRGLEEVITLTIKNLKTQTVYAGVRVYPDNIFVQVVENYGAKIGIASSCGLCLFQNERTGAQTLDEQAQICTLELKDGDTLLILGKETEHKRLV